MNQKWRQFSQFQYINLNEGFCHQIPFQFRLKMNSQRSSFDLHETLVYKQYKFILSDQIRFLNRVGQRHNVIGQIKKGNRLKISYQYEFPQSKSYKNILYCLFSSDRKIQNSYFDCGVQLQTQSLKINSKVRMKRLENSQQYSIYQKLLYSHNYFKLGWVLGYDLESTNNLLMNNLFVELKPHDNHLIYLRGEVDDYRNYSFNYKHFVNYFDFLYANYIIKATQSLTAMAEIKYDLNTEKTKVQILTEKKISNKKLKIKFNNTADLTGLIELPFSVGTNSKFSFGIQIGDILKTKKISYGFNFNLNFE